MRSARFSFDDDRFFLIPSGKDFVPHFVPRDILAQKKGLRKDRNPLNLLVGAVGFEPTASCSQGRRANQAALRPDSIEKGSIKKIEPEGTGSPGRTRTADKVVNSHLLYQLSYRGSNVLAADFVLTVLRLFNLAEPT
jgi:hypothetical protein